MVNEQQVQGEVERVFEKKISGKNTDHARAITFQLAEVTVSGVVFRRILAAIHPLRSPPVPA